MGSGTVPRCHGPQLNQPLSPNHGPRRDGLRPGLIVLHFTGMTTFEAALARLCDPVHQVSSHYLISEGGEVLTLVPEPLRAWHAGAGTWAGAGDVNSRSIGIELANPGNVPFAQPQMRALERLLPGIMARWNIPPEGVIGHSDMAPLRKADPGPRFDWRRLALGGLSVWPETEEVAKVDPAAFHADLVRFGHDANLSHDTALAAFRLRFRPHARGPLDRHDCAMAADLARRFAAARPADPAS
ncbi:MAG: N-acetylmuramoyl-L-alanine amidase [Rubellimicrobium sp.]|nr:N-acetylmuramoyl-L-alanine amidase [Rubellimicrobium sp.]